MQLSKGYLEPEAKIMTDLRGVIGLEPSPTSATSSLDEVAAILFEGSGTPIDNVGPQGSSVDVVAEEELCGYAAQQTARPIAPEHPTPIAQVTPDPPLTATPHIDIPPPSPPKTEHTIPLAEEPPRPSFYTPPRPPPKNIIFFGETGVGKSAIINMLRERSEEQFDDAVASVSSAALGCTLISTKYPCRLWETVFMLWDTAGLVEGEFGNVTSGKAEDNLVNLLRNIEGGGVSLLVYCIRARRFRTIIKSHYELFFEKTCERKVPILLVVTGLENEECMENWWARNEQEFLRRDIEFSGHACITSTKGKAVEGGGHIFDEEYDESVQHLRGAIFNLSLPTNVQISSPGESPWTTFDTLASQSTTGWTAAKQGMKGVRKKLAAMVPNGMGNPWPVEDTQIRAQPVYSTTRPQPPGSFTDEPSPPQGAYTAHGNHHPERTYIARLPTKLGPRISVPQWAPALTQTQPVFGVPAPRHPLAEKLPPDVSSTPVHALTQIRDDTAQTVYNTVGPHPARKRPSAPTTLYIDNGIEPIPFHM